LACAKGVRSKSEREENQMTHGEFVSSKGTKAILRAGVAFFGRCKKETCGSIRDGPYAIAWCAIAHFHKCWPKTN
jgi:hypothetical protein